MCKNCIKIDLSSICVPSEDVVAREIEGDMILVPLVSGIGDADDELYSLNGTGKAIWQKLDGKKTLGDVASHLAEDFEGEPAELEADILGFVSEMVRRGMIKTLGD